MVYNKIDLLSEPVTGLGVSATQGTGLIELKNHIKKIAGYQSEDSNVFSARSRHIAAIDQAAAAVDRGRDQLIEYKAGELLAEELHQAQQQLNSITGEFSNDDLLGEIFSSFCIGK